MAREEFLALFTENTKKRSRTSKGVGHTAISPKKKGPLKTGDDLIRQVHENTSVLAEKVWAQGFMLVSPFSDLRFVVNAWFDCVQKDILDKDTNHGTNTTKFDFVCPINPRYRTWEVNYASPEQSPSPVHLEIWMEAYYAELVKRAVNTNGTSVRSVAELLAWADREMDLVIHPWYDGCSRISTSLVMWLALRVSEVGLPRFGTRDEHYAAIMTKEKHTEYFVKCLTS
jgi:hypothetical protein